jgi:hypothetical protein
MHCRLFTLNVDGRKIYRKQSMNSKAKSGQQFARVAANLAIGVVGLAIVRVIVQSMPVFQEAGWIVKDKLKVVAVATILVDAMLLFFLVAFALEIREYLRHRFIEIPGMATMAANLVLLIAAAIAYSDFKPLPRAWPSIKDIYLWGFFAVAAALLVQIIVLLYQNRDAMAALALHQSVPSASEHHSNSADAAAFARQ